MKLTNRQIVDAIHALKDWLSLDLPMKIAFTISKNAKTLDTVAVPFNELKSKLIEKHKKPNAETATDGTVELTDKEAYVKDITELLDAENEINLELIKETTLFAECDKHSIKIKPTSIFNIMWMFE